MLSRLWLSWWKRRLRSFLFGRCRSVRTRNPRAVAPILEPLEGRVLPSVVLNFMEFHDTSHIPAGVKPSPRGILPQDNGFPFPVGYLPQDLAAAYGIDHVMFGSVVGDGNGQTIAIVDAFDDPAFLNSTDPNFSKSDLAQFDAEAGIPDPPSFLKVNQDGQTSPLPGTDPAGAGNINGNWEIEEALDIEYAHGIAPAANIILVEASTDSDSDLYHAVQTAASLPGVSAVSMSWGENEFNTQSSLDGTFVTPTGHPGVTFLAASGDFGGFAYDANGNPTTTPGILYPAASPNVLAVGGTSLVLNDDDTVASETAWSGSGGGTSLYASQPSYQSGVQTTGHRTIPDVAFDADPNTGVAIYDSYNDKDNSGPWVEIGGTSLGAPAWSALIAIANQGRAIAGGGSLDGARQALPALYAFPPTDFTDITSGDNGVFSAGPGYDEVTGLGTPSAPNLMADLSTYGTANHMGVTSQPPANVIVGDRFGIVVAAEDAAGGVDPAFNGTVTIALDANPTGATLSGTLTATAVDGYAVFDGLTLNQIGSGYTIRATSTSFPAITSSAFNIIADPTPWQGTFYAVPTDASLRTAISLADSNGFAFNTIVLSASTTLLSDKSSGGLVIRNASSLPSKTLTITGQGAANTVIGSVFNWRDRIFEIEGNGGQSLNVTLQGLTIQGGNALNGGVLGGSDALGGGLLIDNANVTLTNVVMQKNQAQGAIGAAGKAGTLGAPGGAGGDGKNARGGGIYLASGTLSLFNDTLSGNAARGGKGGMGGAGGGQGTKSAPAVNAGDGGSGGPGGTAAGGGIYAAGGTVLLEQNTFRSNLATGGPGGSGGTGGSGGHGRVSPPIAGKRGGAGGGGGAGGAASGGAIYLAGGSLTTTGTALQNNAARGGVGGAGGHGGPGTAEGGTLTNIFGGGGTTFNLGGGGGPSVAGGPGGSAGPGGAGAAASAGGIYVAGGTLTSINATFANNQAVGGQGGAGGQGGTAGFGGATAGFGIPVGEISGNGGTGGQAGPGNGGAILVAGGTAVLYADTFNANLAQGGKGGAGGAGGSGPIAVVFGTGGIITGTGGGGGGGTLPTGGGGTAINTAGAGGTGGNGATGKGGGLYVSGGALTLINSTIAGDTGGAGQSGSGGPGGHAGTGHLTGGIGDPGNPGDSYGGGLYVSGGTVSLDNSTIALDTQQGNGYGGGAVVQTPGTVTAVSTLFGKNGTVDYSGDITATNSLFQTTLINGTMSGSGNVVGSDPMLNTNGLQNNGGPTQTVALQAGSPAIGAGTNPQNLIADQRGYAPRTGPGGTDIGAYQTGAQADSQAPTATVQAAAVTNSNAVSLNPYTFTITYADNVAVAAATLPGPVVEVLPPGAAAPLAATVVSKQAVGPTDAIGNAPSFIVTYQITPPGGTWTPAANGTYTITLGGGTVTDLAGNAVASGSLGTFTVDVARTATTTAVASSLNPSKFGQPVTLTATVTLSSPGTGTPTGTVTFTANGKSLGTATLGASGTATFTTIQLPIGTDTITAVYGGDAIFSASTSAALTQTVTIGLPTPPVMRHGSPVGPTGTATPTATVSPPATTPPAIALSAPAAALGAVLQTQPVKSSPPAAMLVITAAPTHEGTLPDAGRAAFSAGQLVISNTPAASARSEARTLGPPAPLPATPLPAMPVSGRFDDLFFGGPPALAVLQPARPKDWELMLLDQFFAEFGQ